MEIYQENGLYGLKNDCGEVIISPQYREFYPFSCGLACVQNGNYQYAYINEGNKAIVRFGDYIWLDHRFICGYARVIKYSVIEDKQYWGIINTMGLIVVPCEYDNIWTLNEEYLDNLKAVKNSKECRINLKKVEKYTILDGLKYIKTYTVDEFKSVFNVSRIFVKINPENSVISFHYGTNIGIVSNDGYMTDPVISIVCNSAGKIFCLLHHRNNVGVHRVKQQIIKRPYEIQQGYTIDYDSYNDYNDYVEELRLDAFEGDESNDWNID